MSQSMSSVEEAEGIIKAFDRSKNSVINEHGLNILVVKNYEDTKIPSFAAYDVIILDYHNPQRSYELLAAVRSSIYDEIYLKPVFILAFDREVRLVDKALSDGVLDELTVSPFMAKIERIVNTTEEILKINTDFSGRKILLKLIRFLYSRDTTLKPVPTKSSLMGYSFPFLDVNIEQYEYQEVIDLFMVGLDKGYLSEDFVDYVHLCSNCLSGFINYRETCPKCGTGKHESQHTIHHFVCGYVGPESDFQHKKGLVCPKCDRQLRHIGVDYDKPSLVSECENGHIFQQPVMKTFCFNCHEENELGNLFDYKINEYTLTASGAHVAVSGKTKEKREVEELEGFVSLAVFKTFLKVEIQRQKALQKTSSVTYMNLMLAPSTLKNHQDEYTAFSHELAKLVKNQLKPTEIVSFLNDDVFLVLTPEQSKEETSARFEEIKSTMLSVIKNNFEGSDNDKIFHETFEMELSAEADSILDRINEKINIF